MARGNGQCKHQLASGCAYCHAGQQATFELLTQNGSKRANRAARYAMKLEAAMKQEGPMWRAQAFKPMYDPLPRSLAVHKMGYNGC